MFHPSGGKENHQTSNHNHQKILCPLAASRRENEEKRSKRNNKIKNYERTKKNI